MYFRILISIWIIKVVKEDVIDSVQTHALNERRVSCKGSSFILIYLKKYPLSLAISLVSFV